MFSDIVGEPDSPLNDSRLPSLLALRCFEAAARLEHFSRAADELHLTHGAVSRAVRLLEDELGVALFERRSRRVHLTSAGRTLAQAVTGGFNLMRNAVNELRASAQRERRWILSCEPTLLMRWLIPRWPDFQARHPEIDVHLVAGGGPFAFANGIDLAIRRDDFVWPSNYRAHALFAERVGPVCRPDKVTTWCTAKGSKATLGPNAHLLHTRTRPDAWKNWAAATNRTWAVETGQSFEHFYFSLQAAVAGLGVAIGSWHMVRDDLDNGLLAAPWGFVEDGSHYCLFSPNSLCDHSPQASLLEWLKEMAKKHPSEMPGQVTT